VLVVPSAVCDVLEPVCGPLAGEDPSTCVVSVAGAVTADGSATAWPFPTVDDVTTAAVVVDEDELPPTPPIATLAPLPVSASAIVTTSFCTPGVMSTVHRLARCDGARHYARTAAA